MGLRRGSRQLCRIDREVFSQAKPMDSRTVPRVVPPSLVECRARESRPDFHGSLQRNSDTVCVPSVALSPSDSWLVFPFLSKSAAASIVYIILNDKLNTFLFRTHDVMNPCSPCLTAASYLVVSFGTDVNPMSLVEGG